MARKIPPLSARKVETIKPGAKAQALFDGGGLFLLVPEAKYSPDGKLLPASKLWRLKYRFEGRPHMISLGSYPEISLEEARARRAVAREQVAKGINPIEDRRRRRAEIVQEEEGQGNTFERVARQWYDVAVSDWAPSYARTVEQRMQNDVFPVIGTKLITEVTTRTVLEVLRLVEERQAYETAHRIKTIIGQVFTFAIITGIPGVDINPASGLSKALKRPVSKSMAAILEPEKLGRLLRDIDGYSGTHIVRSALKLAPMLFVRPGELRHAEWSEIDLDAGAWRLPVEKMKLTVREKARRKGEVHLVPLARQAVAVLKDLRLFTGAGKFVFPGRSASRPMSDNSVNAALRTLGWDTETVTGHGFRATARTMLHETLGFSPDAIEAQLGHSVPDRLGTAYNRTKHLPERTCMMQEWANYLDGLKGVDLTGKSIIG